MRWTIILLATASLSACNLQRETKLQFDGAGAADKAAVLAHGERLSHILGCRGCHQPNLQGALFNTDTLDLGRLYASNLTRAVPTMSDAQLRALLKTGKHPVRGDLWIMPSETFQRLSDADLDALIAHLRTLTPAGAPTPPPVLTDKGKALAAAGKFRPVTAYMAEYRTKLPPDLGPKHAFGRYLAGATCAECHGPDLTGDPDFAPGLVTPDLDIAGTYSGKELARLLTTGEGKTRKDLGLMSEVGVGHFAHLTDHERAALIAYVKARAERPK